MSQEHHTQPDSGGRTQMQATRSLSVSQPIPSQWCHRSIIHSQTVGGGHRCKQLDHCLYRSQYHHSDVTGASYSARQWGEGTQMQATRSLPVSQPIPSQWCHRSIILSQTVGEDTWMQATRSLPVSQLILPQWCHRSIILSQTVGGGHTDASN